MAPCACLRYEGIPDGRGRRDAFASLELTLAAGARRLLCPGACQGATVRQDSDADLAQSEKRRHDEDA